MTDRSSEDALLATGPRYRVVASRLRTTADGGRAVERMLSAKMLCDYDAPDVDEIEADRTMIAIVTGGLDEHDDTTTWRSAFQQMLHQASYCTTNAGWTTAAWLRDLFAVSAVDCTEAIERKLARSNDADGTDVAATERTRVEHAWVAVAAESMLEHCVTHGIMKRVSAEGALR